MPLDLGTGASTTGVGDGTTGVGIIGLGLLGDGTVGALAILIGVGDGTTGDGIDGDGIAGVGTTGLGITTGDGIMALTETVTTEDVWRTTPPIEDITRSPLEIETSIRIEEEIL